MDFTILQPVGPRQPNREQDVRTIQQLLNSRAGLTGMRLVVNGRFDIGLEVGIVRFQRETLRQTFADGVIRPKDLSFWVLTQSSQPRLLCGALGGILHVAPEGPLDLDKQDFERMGVALQAEGRAIEAVHLVESRYGPYDKLGRPPILFERHLFGGLTFHRFDITYPFISARTPGGYTFPEADQYRRLQQAFALDRDAALKSASWGGFQILGLNHNACGYGTVTSFVQAMCHSKEEQCDAFVSFIKSNRPRWQALQAKDWRGFAKSYNGPNYWQEKPPYDKRLEAAYAEAGAL